jgi:uncharacterized repeat protein (TIGR03833 family)
MILNNINNLILELNKDEHMVRENIKRKQVVDIVLKKDQPTGILTRGEVYKILSPGKIHTRGIKVMLSDGKVGRVQRIITDV